MAIALAVLLVRRFRALPHLRPLPRHGTVGAVLLIGAMFLNAMDVVIVEVFFTPLCWTGYILWADGAIAALRGRSLLRDNRRHFLLLTICSIPLWMIFEVYNLRLHNWIYAGLPSNSALRVIAFVWAFATIWPGVFTTATLLRAMDWNAQPEPAEEADPEPAEENEPWGAAPLPTPAHTAWNALSLASMAVGIVFFLVPVLLPQSVGIYLFGAVWLGPVLLLEPINMRLGHDSLWRAFSQQGRRGDRSRLNALLWAGAICGILWEFWNHAAAARWVYTFPIFPEWRIFAMPVVGYLGFPVFALDCFVMYALIEPALRRGLDKLSATPAGSPTVLEL